MALRKGLFALGLMALLGATSQGFASPPPQQSNNTQVYGSTPMVVAQIVAEGTKQTAGLISTRISSAVSNATGAISISPTRTSSLSEGTVGKAAGDSARRGGVWLNGSNNWMSGDHANANFSGTLQTAVAGVDYLVRDNVLVGASLGYEHGDISLKYNGGNFEANNLAFAPYAAYIINDVWSVDASGGHAWVNYDLSRANGTISGDTSGSRWFASTNLNANWRVDAWQLGTSLGYIYTKESTDDYVESDGTNANGPKFRLGQANGKFRVGYLVPTEWGTVNPFGAVRLEYDANKTAASAIDAAGTKAYDDRFGTTFSLGANVLVGDNDTLSIEGSSTQFRDDLKNYSLIGTYRHKF